MLPHEYLDSLYHLRNQEQAEILESIGRAAQRETILTANRVSDHISQLRAERRPLLEAIDSEIERMTGYCSSWYYKLWLESYNNRGFIWMATIGAAFCFFSWAPISARGNGGALSGSDIFIGIVAALSFVWSIWSSIIPDYQTKA